MKTLQQVFLPFLFILLCCIKGIAQNGSQANTNKEMEKGVMLNESNLQWMDAPPNLPKGAKLTILQGNPFQEGPFVIRADFPADYKMLAHTHGSAENITIIKGSLYLGEGEKFDESKAKVLNVGGFASMPGVHYAFTKEPCTFQVHGMGPFVITYINPADDPSAKK